MELAKKEIKELVKYFYTNNLKAHIKLKPTGNVDGHIISDIIDDVIIKVKDVYGKEEDIFLVKIYDIKIFEERV